jgi:hypothetical protein
MWPYDRPDIRPKHDEGELSARQVLLVADVLIRRDHHIEPGLFRHFQKLAIFELIRPSHLDDGMNLMLWKKAADTNRDVFVKQDAQRGDSWRKPKSPRCDPAEARTVLKSRRRLRHSQSYRQSR